MSGAVFCLGFHSCFCVDGITSTKLAISLSRAIFVGEGSLLYTFEVQSECVVRRIAC